jgi:hypothetical protein
MQGYSNGNVRPFIPVHYNGLVEASKQGYNMGSVMTFILVHYND